MIGVIAGGAERAVVCEFFELFKTPWEFYRSGREYDAVLCAGELEFEVSARTTIVYSGQRTKLDGELGFQTEEYEKKCVLTYQNDHIPIYGKSVTFLRQETAFVKNDRSECVAFVKMTAPGTMVRIGFDLFREVRMLLTEGQPHQYAQIPALELHITMLRDVMIACGAEVVEIPPIPEGHRFIACLTHDVDHPSIRLHGWDLTTLGFLWRAVFGSLVNVFRGRISFRGLARNWMAAMKLPFVQVGLVKDFWLTFDERYLSLENGRRSTFFFVPFANTAGTTLKGDAPSYRATRYGARDVAEAIEKLQKAGCEIGLHGIDAWHDSARGMEELKELRQLTDSREIGVRMHWLYFAELSPATLEEAGAAYDSTSGYNDRVGYRAGTTQVYKPLAAQRLLELPMHIMDTALFYPPYMGLSQGQAKDVLGRMADDAARFGGCLTINWHDRSTAPERLWDGCYRDLLHDLERRGAWFATGRDVVAWFRKRREFDFLRGADSGPAGRLKMTNDQSERLPGLCLRIHKAGPTGVTAYADPAMGGTAQAAHARGAC